MTAQLLKMYENGEITADHLVVDVLGMLDPENPSQALAVLPEELLQRAVAFVHAYRPGKMKANFGRIPTFEQIAAAKKWIEERSTKRAV
jgi:hypothetical protein